MAEPEVREAREKVRQREQAIWSDVERVGRDMRKPLQQAVTQAESDTTGKKPKEGFGV